MVGPNQVDRWLDNGVWLAFQSVGATNLVPSDIAQWALSNDGSSPDPVIVDKGGGVHEVTFTIIGAGWGAAISYTSAIAIAGSNGFFGQEYRVTSGVGTDMAVKFAAGDPGGHPDSSLGLDDDGNWHEFPEILPITGRTRPEIQLRGLGEGGTLGAQTVVVEVRDTRFVDNTFFVPSFSDYGNVGDSYGVDRYLASMSYLTEGEIAVDLTPEGWGSDATTKRPNSGARVWSNSGSIIELRYSGSVLDRWLLDGTANNQFDGTTLEGEKVYLFSSWDGVDTRAEGVPGTVSTLADIIQPTGPINLGNNSAGTRSIHGTFSCLKSDEKWTAQERTDFIAWRQGGVLSSEIGSVSSQVSRPATARASIPLSGRVR